MLHGENSGYMDMTCNQTFRIVMEDVYNPDIPMNMSTVTEAHKLNGVPCKTFSAVEKGVVHSDFDDFLVSLSEPRAQKGTASFPKKNNDHFILENASNANPDKDNILPTCLPKHAPLDAVPMDMTTIHHVKPKEREAFRQLPCSVYENCTSTNTNNDLDVMELTRNQTSTINVKEMEHANHSRSYVEQKKSVCDDSSEMIMTGVFDEYVQDLEQLPERSKADRFLSNISFVPVTESNDKEVSQSQPLVLETKPFSSNVDRVIMTTNQRGNITLGALPDSKTEACERNMILETHTIFHQDQSGLMELTCPVSTGILPPNLDDPASTEYSNATCALKPPSVHPEVKDTDHIEREISLSHMVDDMEITRPHTGCDDMEMTQCQTVLAETKNCSDFKPFDKSKVEMSTSFGNKSMIHERTGQTEPSRYSFSKRTSTGTCVIPTRFFLQDLPGCMEEQQGTVSNISVIHDDMDLTELKTLPLNTKTSPCGLSSKPTVDQTKRYESILEQLGPGLVSQAVDGKSLISVMDLDAGNLEDEHRETISDVFDVNVDRDITANTLKEDCSMEITGAFTAPLKEQCCAVIKQDETAAPVPVSINQNVSKDSTMAKSDKTVSSARKRYAFESDIDTLKNEHSSSVKSRRSCLAVLQAKLQNITQCISEPDGLLAGSVTAPLLSYAPMTPEEKRPKSDESLQPPMETQLTENKINLPNEEVTTPYHLKKSLMARLSVSAVMPLFSTRARSTSPNQTEPKSPDGLQGLQLQTCFNADLQSGCCEPDLVDEVLPEEDLSGTLVSYLGKPEREFTGVDFNKEAMESDYMESDMNRSYSEKMAPEGNNGTMKDTTKKVVRFF